MATKYKLYPKNEYGKEVNYIERTLDNGTISCIPKATYNTDYIEYQEWLAAGNTPDAAD
tara:strand:- start:43 stop:219 length:177 start_codon:yes stop_codon:yes gene_type:complete